MGLVGALAVAVGLTLVACGPGRAIPLPTSVVSSAPTSTTAMASEPRLAIAVLVDGLDTPWAMAFAPDGRIFLTERGGAIRVVQDGQLLPTPWATVPAAEVGEAGLLGIALDPDFARNGFVYVAFTYSDGGRLFNRLVRMREEPGTRTGTLDGVLLEHVPGGSIHDGGRVKVGPDGMLYWTVGVGNQQAQSAQDPATLDGKILRLNPDGTVPADNPFPGSPVYAYGLRNPQGLAWQPGAGLLFAIDHGPSGGVLSLCCRDEVNLIEPGLNYGWPVITGDEAQEGMVSPVLHSGATVTWAPSGAAFVTQGPWAGALLFAGLRGQSLYRVTLDPSNARRVLHVERLLEGQFGRLRDVAEGPDGAIYVLTSNLDGRGSAPPEGDKLLRITVGS